MDGTPLPQDKEGEWIRVESAQRVSEERIKHWDSKEVMDYRIKALLGFAGVQCRIIGSSFFDNDLSNPAGPFSILPALVVLRRSEHRLQEKLKPSPLILEFPSELE
jgi:hypothetical protein